MSETKTLSAIKSIPVAPGPPVIGNLMPMLRTPMHFMVDTYKTCGEVFQVRVLNKRFTVIAGVEANRFMIHRERDFLQNGPIFGGYGIELGGELFLGSADGDIHKQLRRLQTPSYSISHLRPHAPKMVTQLRRRLGGLHVGQRLDVQRLFQILLAEQVGELLLNNGKVAHILDDIIRVFRTALSVKVMRRWPSLMLKTPAYRRSKARLFQHVSKLVEEHKSNPSPERNDLVDDILAAVERGELIREENIPLLVLGPLFAGIDTASNTCSFILYNILSRPEVYERVMDEVHGIFANPTPDWEAFKGMTALRGTVMETLRMYPVAYMATRQVVNPFEFGGYHIEADQNLLIATAVPHFLPELYPSPHQFDIDRYRPDRREHAHPGAFAPFGVGVHTCLGARFAQAQIMVTIATIMHLLQLEIDPPDYELCIKSNPVAMPHGLAVRVRSLELTPSEEVEPWPGFSIDAKHPGFFQRLVS